MTKPVTRIPITLPPRTAAAATQRRPQLSREARAAVVEEITSLSSAPDLHPDDAIFRDALSLLLQWHDEGRLGK